MERDGLRTLILRVGGSRALLSFDVYNLFSSSAVTALNSTFGGRTRWQRPQGIDLARYAKVRAQIDFYIGTLNAARDAAC